MTFADEVVVGGERWSVTAPDRRFARIIGDAYRVTPTPPAGPIDLCLVIVDDPAPHIDPPVSVHVDRSADEPVVQLRVHDPTLDDQRLHYFLWVNINAALVRLGQFLVHAASFTLDDRLFLVTGPSGAGKSTLAFAFGLAGAVVHSDDWSVARRGDGGVTVSGVTSTMRITDETRTRFGADRIGDAERSSDEKHKWVFDAGDVLHAEPAVRRRPDRIVILTAGTSTTTRPATAGEVTRHLFEESKQTLYLPDAQGLVDYLDCCTSLALSAPAVHVGRDAGVDSLADVVEIVRNS